MPLSSPQQMKRRMSSQNVAAALPSSSSSRLFDKENMYRIEDETIATTMTKEEEAKRQLRLLPPLPFIQNIDDESSKGMSTTTPTMSCSNSSIFISQPSSASSLLSPSPLKYSSSSVSFVADHNVSGDGDSCGGNDINKRTAGVSKQFVRSNNYNDQQKLSSSLRLVNRRTNNVDDDEQSEYVACEKLNKYIERKIEAFMRKNKAPTLQHKPMDAYSNEEMKYIYDRQKYRDDDVDEKYYDNYDNYKNTFNDDNNDDDDKEHMSDDIHDDKYYKDPSSSPLSTKELTDPNEKGDRHIDRKRYGQYRENTAPIREQYESNRKAKSLLSKSSTTSTATTRTRNNNVDGNGDSSKKKNKNRNTDDVNFIVVTKNANEITVTIDEGDDLNFAFDRVSNISDMPLGILRENITRLNQCIQRINEILQNPLKQQMSMWQRELTRRISKS